MSKLVDIKGYWNMSGGYDFNDNDMWKGKLLLEDDGWFEGIVNDPTSPYTGDRMVFGIYHPTKAIELLKISPANVSDPFVFRGQRDAKGYEGDFSVLGFFGEQRCGVSHLITQHVDYLKEKNYPEVADRDIEAEKEELAKRIATFKQNDDFADLYENTIGMRANLSEYVLRRYNGNTFTTEQIEAFLEPVNDKVEEATNNAVKKLVKEMNPNNFDDLPF